MTLVDGTPLPERVDILIVGGGLAGLQVAKELDRRGASNVLVVEAGPADDLAHINIAHDADTALRMWVEPDTDPHFWRPWNSKSDPHYAGAAGLRRRLGGRSLYWQGVVLPLESWALSEPWWPADVVHDLTRSWRGGPSLYELATTELEEWRAAGGPLPEAAEPLEVGGYRLLETPQAARGIAVGGGDQPWSAYSPADHWHSGQAGSAIGIAARIEVLGVTVADGAATGVLVRDSAGVQRHIAAEHVVLAAGTIENTRLAVQAWHEVGRAVPERVTGLVDHITQGFVAVLEVDSLPARIRELAARDSFFYCHGQERSRSNMFVRIYRNDVGAVVLDAWTMGEQMPSAETVVECAQTAEWPWEVTVHAGLTDEDRVVVEAQRDELRDFWQQWCAATGVDAGEGMVFPEFDHPERTLEQVMPGVAAQAADNRPITWCGPLGSEYHEASTLPLGGAVGDDHQLADVRRLYVAGPATFPRIGAANPSLTSLALAKRLAAMLPA